MITRRIKCLVIEVPAENESAPEDFPSVSRRDLNSRARDLVPWADPYIARLIAKLQAEVRQERAAQRMGGRFTETEPVSSEALPPQSDPDLEFELPDFDRWQFMD